MASNGIEKLYYSIGEVSKLTGLEQHVLRYWETEFDVLKPQKNRAGRRIYTRSDIEHVLHIKRLLRDEKYTIEGARQTMVQDPDGKPEFSDTQGELLALRGFLMDLLKRI